MSENQCEWVNKKGALAGVRCPKQKSEGCYCITHNSYVKKQKEKQEMIASIKTLPKQGENAVPLTPTSTSSNKSQNTKSSLAPIKIPNNDKAIIVEQIMTDDQCDIIKLPPPDKPPITNIVTNPNKEKKRIKHKNEVKNVDEDEDEDGDGEDDDDDDDKTSQYSKSSRTSRVMDDDERMILHYYKVCDWLEAAIPYNERGDLNAKEFLAQIDLARFHYHTKAWISKSLYGFADVIENVTISCGMQTQGYGNVIRNTPELPGLLDYMIVQNSVELKQLMTPEMQIASYLISPLVTLHFGAITENENAQKLTNISQNDVKVDALAPQIIYDE